MVANTTQSVSTMDTDTSVSTFGWDTAYIASFPVVNQAIIKQQSYPQQFNYLDANGITISGNWSSWQLTPGGAGGNVQMICTVQSGSATGFGQNGDLKGSSVVIQVNLQTVAANDPVNDPTAKDQGTSQNLVVNTNGKGLDPAVSIISSNYKNVQSLVLKDLLDSVFKDYFNANIGEFNHVFAVMNLNEVADQDGFQWLKPTAFQYAVASPEDASLENSAFGLIAMVQNHQVEPSMQQAVDVRALSHLPTGANSAFVIGETMVAQNMILRGAIATIQGSSASDFGFSPDGLSVTNVNDVVWGHFQTAKNGIISPKIAANNFVMHADDTYVYLEISNAEYETSPGVTVHMNLAQKFTYSTVKAKNGNYVFIPDITGFGNPSITASVSLSEGLQITQIITGAIAAVAGLVAGGAGLAGSLAADATTVTTDTVNNTGELVMDEQSIQGILNNSDNSTNIIQVQEEGSTSVDEGISDPTNTAQVQKGGMFTSTLLRNLAGMTSAIAGAVTASITIAKAVTQMEYDHIPAFNTFAANCMGASAWPGLSDYKLIGANFRRSLVIALSMDAADD